MADLRPAPLTGLSFQRVPPGFVPAAPTNAERYAAFQQVVERENLPPGNNYPWPHKENRA